MNRHLNITLDTDGNVKIDAVGFEGNACHEATAAFERRLGGQIIETQDKPEATQIFGSSTTDTGLTQLGG